MELRLVRTLGGWSVEPLCADWVFPTAAEARATAEAEARCAVEWEAEEVTR